MPTANDRIGPYQLTRKLGAGNFGEVWLARDLSGSAQREVAIKMPLKSEIDLDALLQEATLWARASAGDHPNVLGFLAARVLDGQVVLISEYAPDGSLRDWLKQHHGRAPSIEAALEMTRGVLAGLEHLHRQSIIHRDIKPDNVLLVGTTPRLADFGISRVLKSVSLTAQGAGTPLYMVPEAFKRKRNQQTDLWSVGVMLYRMLSGRLPFDGADITEVYGAILNEEPDPLPASVPEWLRQPVAKALRKDPEQRFKTAAEMRQALTPLPPTIKDIPVPLPPRRTVTADAPPPKPQPTFTEPPLRSPAPPVVTPLPQPKPTLPAKPRPVVKWGAGLAVVIALATTIYYATQTTAPTTPDPSGYPDPDPSPQRPAATGNEFSVKLANGVNIQMVHLPGGEFTMGGDRYDNEKPPHRVARFAPRHRQI